MTKKQMANILRLHKGGISDTLCIAMILELMKDKPSSLIADQIVHYLIMKDK